MEPDPEQDCGGGGFPIWEGFPHLDQLLVASIWWEKRKILEKKSPYTEKELLEPLWIIKSTSQALQNLLNTTGSVFQSCLTPQPSECLLRQNKSPLWFQGKIESNWKPPQPLECFLRGIIKSLSVFLWKPEVTIFTLEGILGLGRLCTAFRTISRHDWSTALFMFRGFRSGLFRV